MWHVGILVPRPGIAVPPPAPALGAQSHNHWATRDISPTSKSRSFLDLGPGSPGPPQALSGPPACLHPTPHPNLSNPSRRTVTNRTPSVRWARCFRYLPKRLSKSFLLPPGEPAKRTRPGMPAGLRTQGSSAPPWAPGTQFSWQGTLDSLEDRLSVHSPRSPPWPRAVPAEGLDLSASISCTAQDNEAHLA